MDLIAAVKVLFNTELKVFRKHRNKTTKHDENRQRTEGNSLNRQTDQSMKLTTGVTDDQLMKSMETN